MKLIDLLVKELPKRGGWPQWAASTAVYPLVSRFIFFDDKGNSRDGGEHPSIDIPNPFFYLEGKHVITRAQYEAAIAKNDGWIEWGGGGCPVPQGTLVDVRYRCGKENHHVKAGIFGDDSGSDPEHHAGCWGGYNSQWDIIAYRLHREINSRANDNRLEQDLNECIGQGIDPAWNGDGLPPVGCECEVKSGDTFADYDWVKIKVAYSHMGELIGIVDMPGESIHNDMEKLSAGYCGAIFRPLRTEAEKVRESACHEIASMIGRGTFFEDAERIYDAISSGEIKVYSKESK